MTSTFTQLVFYFLGMLVCICKGELLGELANNGSSTSEFYPEMTSQEPDFLDSEFDFTTEVVAGDEDETEEITGSETSYQLLKVTPPYTEHTASPPSLATDSFQDKIGIFVDDENEKYYAPTTQSNFRVEKPQTNHPTLSAIPETDFNCQGKAHDTLYPDFQAGCQVFHSCQRDGRKSSFLCPNGTLFDSKQLVCNWWYEVTCTKAEEAYNFDNGARSISYGHRQGKSLDLQADDYEQTTLGYDSEEFLDEPYYEDSKRPANDTGYSTTESYYDNSNFDSDDDEYLAKPDADFDAQEKSIGSLYDHDLYDSHDAVQHGSKERYKVKLTYPNSFVNIQYGTEGYKNLQYKPHINQAPNINRHQGARPPYYDTSTPRPPYYTSTPRPFLGNSFADTGLIYERPDAYRSPNNYRRPTNDQRGYPNAHNSNRRVNQEYFAQNHNQRRPSDTRSDFSNSFFVDGWRGFNAQKFHQYRRFNPNSVQYPTRVQVANRETRHRISPIQSSGSTNGFPPNAQHAFGSRPLQNHRETYSQQYGGFQKDRYYPPLLKRTKPILRKDSPKVYREPGTTSYVPVFLTSSSKFAQLNPSGNHYMLIGADYNMAQNNVRYELLPEDHPHINYRNPETEEEIKKPRIVQ